MDYYKSAWKKYAVFDGRASRSEYWMFFLWNLIVTIVIGIVSRILGVGFIQSLYTLAVIVPSISILARRLHDTGRSGWWMLIGLIPLIGTLTLLIFTVLESQPGTNEFGPNPYGLTEPSGKKNPFVILVIVLFIVGAILAFISIVGVITILKTGKPGLDVNVLSNTSQVSTMATSTGSK